MKKINPDDFEYIKDLKKVKALLQHIAEALTERKGTQYNSSEVRYLIRKINEAKNKSAEVSVEQTLTELRDNGSTVLQSFKTRW